MMRRCRSPESPRVEELPEKGRDAVTSMSNSSLKSLLKLGGPWFYVCFGSREGRGMGDGFVVQTYSDLYKLLTEESADKTEADVYICSKERGGRMALRRVVALRPVGSPNMHAFELEDGQVVLWVDGKTSATVYIEIGGRVSLVD